MPDLLDESESDPAVLHPHDVRAADVQELVDFERNPGAPGKRQIALHAGARDREIGDLAIRDLSLLVEYLAAEDRLAAAIVATVAGV